MEDRCGGNETLNAVFFTRAIVTGLSRIYRLMRLAYPSRFRRVYSREMTESSAGGRAGQRQLGAPTVRTAHHLGLRTDDPTVVAIRRMTKIMSGAAKIRP